MYMIRGKILLIAPSWNYVHRSLKFISKKIAVAPPLGLLYIATVAESEDWETQILDCDAETLSLEDILERVDCFSPDIIGFSVTTPFFGDVVSIAKNIKQSTKTPIIIGGPHPTVAGKDSLIDCFDFALTGEGEVSFKMFLQSFISNKDYFSVPGLIFRANNNIIVNKVPSLELLMDQLPIPSRRFFKIEKYKTNVPGCGEKVYTSIMITRGCPYKCIFCSVNTIFGRKLRFRSLSLVIDEIKECMERYGITHFHFVDDTLTVNREYVVELCNRIIEENLGITWEGWTRVDCVDEELFSLMKNSGFVRVSFGVETGSEEIMKIIKKRITHEQIHRAFVIANKLGIESRCSVMIGHPGETKKTLWQTINFVRKEKNILYSTLAIATPYPGTELAKMASEGSYGLRLLSKDVDRYFRYFSPVMEMNDLKAVDLKLTQIVGLLWIHLTPKRIYHVIKRFGIINIGFSSILTVFSLLKVLWARDKWKNTA